MGKKTKKNIICYTGEGSKKKHHSKKEFLSIMKKNFKKECSKFNRSKKCKPCKKLKKYNEKFLNVNNKNSNKLKKVNLKIDKYTKKCEKCKKRKFHKCSLKNYLEYSGASKGKCD